MGTRAGHPKDPLSCCSPFPANQSRTVSVYSMKPKPFPVVLTSFTGPACTLPMIGCHGLMAQHDHEQHAPKHILDALPAHRARKGVASQLLNPNYRDTGQEKAPYTMQCVAGVCKITYAPRQLPRPSFLQEKEAIVDGVHASSLIDAWIGQRCARVSTNVAPKAKPVSGRRIAPSLLLAMG